MRKELIEQVSEIVKTINFNIDSETGRAALEETLKEVIPLVKWYIIMEKIYGLVFLIVLLGGISLCLCKMYKIVNRTYEEKG